MTTQASPQAREEHYRDANAAKIQGTISVLAAMESQLDELASQVAEMKRKLHQSAEAEAEKAKSEILDSARKEADDKLETVRAAAKLEADKIVSKGDSDAQALRSRVSKNLPDAVDLIVKTVLSV
jgi:vacuolar-type H+-ATPase subunit H